MNITLSVYNDLHLGVNWLARLTPISHKTPKKSKLKQLIKMHELNLNILNKECSICSNIREDFL